MAATLAVETVKYVASGRKQRPPDEIDRIRRICEFCDHVFYEGLAMRCGKCGFVRISHNFLSPKRFGIYVLWIAHLKVVDIFPLLYHRVRSESTPS